MTTYDPDQERARLLYIDKNSLGVQPDQMFNALSCSLALTTCLETHLLGLNDEARWRLHYQQHLAQARAILQHQDQVPKEKQEYLPWLHMNVALLLWIETDEQQQALFKTALDLEHPSLEKNLSSLRPKYRKNALEGALLLLAAAGRSDAESWLLRRFEWPAPTQKEVGATVLDLIRAMASDDADKTDIARRCLKIRLTKMLEEKRYTHACLLLYTAQQAGVPGTASTLVSEALRHVPYLQPGTKKKQI